MDHIFTCATIGAFSLVACQTSPTSPDDVGPASAFNHASLESAAAYSAVHGGSAMLVWENGATIFEAYVGADEGSAQHIHSATKAFWAAAAAAAIEDGLIDGEDERVAETITEWKDTNRHPGKDLITVEHLLTLSSGLSQDLEQIQGLDASEPDIYRYVVDELRLVAPPGTRFQYGPSHYYAFGVMLQRKLIAAGMDKSPLVYLQSRILSRIGVAVDDWVHDAAGNPHIPNGCYITPTQWAKFGRFLLQNGEWEGTQVIRADLMTALRTPSARNPGHGRFLWLNTRGGMGVLPSQVAPANSVGGWIYHDGHPDLFGALGAGKNRMYMVPALRAVILRQSPNEDDGFVDNEFLRLALAR